VCIASAAAPDETAWRSLVEAERAFARMSVEKGMQAAFLANLAPDAVVFRPGPVPAVAWFREHAGAGGILEWTPDFAAVAAGGDGGYTSGPWAYRDRPGDEPVTGHFVSIWRRDEDGAWKVVLDTGIRHPVAAESHEVTRGLPGTASDTEPGEEARAATIAAVRRLEMELAAKASARGRLAALRTYAAEDIRMYEPDRVPIVGRTALQKLDARHDGTMRWTPSGSGATRAGDLGYVYGTGLRTRETADSSVEATAFVRIWRRRSHGSFEIVLDACSPMPAPPAPADSTVKP
jgi:ketosteroid isomerase-like protein